MKITCTKEEFRKMSVSCSMGTCECCVFYELCNGDNFSIFVEDIDCNANNGTESEV